MSNAPDRSDSPVLKRVIFSRSNRATRGSSCCDIEKKLFSVLAKADGRMRHKNYNLPAFISSTISGFKSVDVSPKFEKSPSAILRKMRLMIFPERVLGNPDTN